MKHEIGETIIFGGAFNPPTIAHQAIIETALNLPGVEEVIVLPSGDRYDKYFSIDKEHRLAMLQILIDECLKGKSVSIDTREIEKDSLTETYETAVSFSNEYPDKKFRYVFGVDSIQTMHEWNNGAWMRENLEFAVVSRDGEPPIEDINITPISLAFDGVSSTVARCRAYRGQSQDGVLSEKIADYVANNRLYNTDIC